MSKSRWTGRTVLQNLTRKIGHQQIQKISISKFFILKIFSQNLYACKRKIYNSAALIPLRSQTYNFTRCHINVWVCAGLRRCVQVCTGVCVDMHGCMHVCGMNFQNFFWRIESLHQRTLIRILYEFLI